MSSEADYTRDPKRSVSENLTRWFRAWLRKWAWTVGLLVLSFLLAKFPPVRNASALLWDGVEAFNASAWQSGPPLELLNRLRVIVVDDRDYSDVFKSRSPLSAEELAKQIAGILQHKPDAVFIDIETDDRSFGASSDGTAGREPEDLPDAIVRASGGTLTRESVLGTVYWAETESHQKLGGGSIDGARGFLPRLSPDGDARLRRVSLEVEGQPSVVSLAAVALLRGASPDLSTCHWTKERRYECAPRFHAYLPPTEALRVPLRDIGSVDLQGKVVFLGGTYGRDQFLMGDGKEHPGVEVLAAASLAVAGGGLNRELGEWSEFAIENLVGVLISLAMFWFAPSPRIAWVVGVAVAPIAVVAISLVWTGFQGVISVFGILLGRLIETGIELVERSERAEGEVRRLARVEGGPERGSAPPAISDADPIINRIAMTFSSSSVSVEGPQKRAE